MSAAKAMLVISVAMTFLMILVSLLMYQSVRVRRCLHVLEFWASYMTLFVLNFLTEGHGPKIGALCTLAFIWRTRAVTMILSDVAEKELYRSWFVWVVAAGYLTSIALCFYDLSFTAYTLPAVLSITTVAFTVIWRAWKELSRKKLTPLHYILIFNTAIMYLHTLDYPFLRYVPELFIPGFGLVLFTTLVMAAILPGLTIHDLQQERNKILEVVLSERNLQLEKQSKMSSLGEMTATLVHELNNPLGLLLTRNSLLMRKLDREQMDHETLASGLKQMHSTIHRMMAITQSLKAFSRDSEKEDPSKIHLRTIIDDTMAFTSDRFLDGNVPLLIGKVPEVWVNCRAVQISQVLLNLLNNAYDAVQGHKSQWVRIDFENTGPRVRVSVIDSGKGIPEEIKHKIMLPFFTTKDAGKGTGLGLSISQQIIHDHNGRLFLEEESLNTTFVLELPCFSQD